MKRITLILSAVTCTFLAQSQNYFKEGTRWIYDTYNASFPTVIPTNSERTYWIEASELDGVPALYEDDETFNISKEFKAYIKTEGEKVFFKLDKDPEAEWYLMYDFGLKPGEGAYFYSLLSLPSEMESHKGYLKCTAIEPDPNDPKWEIMKMALYVDETCTEQKDEGSWIRGLGSWNGNSFLHSFYFNATGGGEELREAYENDKLIYTNNSANIQKPVADSEYTLSLKDLSLDIASSSKENISVYSVNGQLLISSPVQCTFQLPAPGIYIVKIGEARIKILAKG